MGIDGKTFIHSIRYEYPDNLDNTKFFGNTTGNKNN